MMQEHHADYVSRYRDRSEDELDRLLEELDDLEGDAQTALVSELKTRGRTNAQISSLIARGIACIESEKLLHEFAGKIKAQRLRNIPPNPAINVNIGFTLPANINPQQLPQQFQQIMQQILQQAAQQLPGLVAQEIQKQSPVIGATAQIVGGVWRKIN